MSSDEEDSKHPDPRESFASCALAYAEAGIRRCLRSTGPILEGERYGAEWRAVEKWCAEEGLIAPPQVWPAREGGREHDLTQLSGTGLWLKFTKPWASGYHVDIDNAVATLLPARPLQYLARLRLQNRYFGDDIRFVGITSATKSRRMIISQPDILGDPPSWQQIEDWFAAADFKKLRMPPLGGYDALAFVGHGIGVFDVRPVNVVMSKGGVLLPIDFMIRRLTPRQAAKLLANTPTPLS